MKINKSLLFFFSSSLQKLHVFYWDVYAFVSVLIITPTIVFSFLIKKEEERESTHLKDTIPREYSLFLRLSRVWQGYCFLPRSLPSFLRTKKMKLLFLTQLLSLCLFKKVSVDCVRGLERRPCSPQTGSRSGFFFVFFSTHLHCLGNRTRIRCHCKH